VTPALKLEHQTQKELAEFLNVSESTVKYWKKNIEVVNTEERTRNLFDLIIEDALKPNADTKQRELAAKLMGLTRKEAEENFEPTATDYAKWARQLIDRLKQDWVQSGGVCPVCSGSQNIFPEIRLDTEQEHRADGKVAGMAVPDGHAGDIPEFSGDSNT